MTYRASFTIRFFIFAALPLLAACAANEPVALRDSPGRIWPDPPQIARIGYYGEFTSASDLGIVESFLDRLVSFAAGRRPDKMSRPMAIVATDDSQVIFVADPEAHCVHRFDLGKRRYARLVVARGMPEASPVGLAITNDDWLYVSDSQRGVLYQVGPGEGELGAFYTSTPLMQPTGIFWSSETDRLYVTDTKSQEVRIFDRKGNFKESISGRGAGPGELNFPTYLWIDNSGELLITDSLNFRIQRFDRRGNFLSEFGKNGDEPGFFSRPKGIATDSSGHIYVIDSLMHSMQVFGRNGQFLISIGGQGQGSGEFWLPAGIFITKDNTIFVADSYNGRVQVFRYVGPET